MTETKQYYIDITILLIIGIFISILFGFLIYQLSVQRLL